MGFVFISNENIITPYIHGGAQERNMRAGTENVAGIAGLAKALEIICESTDSNKKRSYHSEHYSKTNFLLNLWISLLMEVRKVILAHVLSVSFPPGPKADMLVMNLDIAGISASSGSACSAGIEEDSHVLVAIRHPAERKTIRFSFSPFNTEDEIHYTIEN